VPLSGDQKECRVNRLSKLLLEMISLCVMSAPVFATPDDARTVLITGANRGIGYEFVKQYTAKGWNVIATCRNPDSADSLNALATEHDNVVVERLDLVDHPGIDELANKYTGQPIDVLINNAGLMRGPDKGQSFGTIDYSEFDTFFHTNAMGPLKVAEAFWPNVVASEQKTVAALTTGKGKWGIPLRGFAFYKSSKAALDSLQLEIAKKGKSDGVKVVTLQPGIVDTHDAFGNVKSPFLVDIEVSIGGMIDIIDNLTMDQSGDTFLYNGEIRN
jgi:NAD(P)-dependent dehydrogenase (short-subunit alcohol dehydrogenase family)